MRGPILIGDNIGGWSKKEGKYMDIDTSRLWYAMEVREKGVSTGGGGEQAVMTEAFTFFWGSADCTEGGGGKRKSGRAQTARTTRGKIGRFG